MSEALTLLERKHPDKASEVIFESLIGIDQQKDELVSTILFLFDKDRIKKWQHKHHRDGLVFVERVVAETPLVILSGEVGCGKSALANSVGTPVAKELKKRLTCFETPSDVRGGGRVGELSARVTSAFQQVTARIKGDDLGLLIIDEADDLATSRSQNQAHHEDRAGLNVLVKQIDAIARVKVNLVVILITNRVSVLDPAIIRRASVHLTFKRPNDQERRKVFEYLFTGTKLRDNEIEKLVEESRREPVPFSYSDLINRVAKQAVFRAVHFDKSFSPTIYLEVLKDVIPSPLIE
ncbi:MAG: ATP-binding protein [Ignavibacteriae bacterium]|nr:ATP-binding protein [Ignavibacteria bacterium]MBI3365278.1 ATP-binding protein [Ignavibacteriota bacterium]